MKRLIEIACFTVEAALLAAKQGAHRIELCTDYSSGGITPPLEDVQYILQHVNLPVHVMVRPRAGDFVYTPSEIKEMMTCIATLKSFGVAGVVAGVLTKENTIDQACLELLLDASKGLNFTFHRAVDDCVDSDEAIAILAESEVTHVLTSGAKKSALEGAEKIAVWQKAVGHKLHIIPGGSIRSSNLKSVMAITQCQEFHSAAITEGFDIPNANEISLLVQLAQSCD